MPPVCGEVLEHLAVYTVVETNPTPRVSVHAGPDNQRTRSRIDRKCTSGVEVTLWCAIIA